MFVEFPVVLQIDAELLVVRGDIAAATAGDRAEDHLVRRGEAVVDVIRKLRVERILFEGIDRDRLELDPGLDRVVSVPLETEECQVVLETDALLALVLEIPAAAGIEDDLVRLCGKQLPIAGQLEAGGDGYRARTEGRVLVGQVGVIEPALCAVLIVQIGSGVLAGFGGAVLGRVVAPHAGQLVFGAIFGAQLPQVIVGRLPVDLGEVQVLLEGRARGLVRQRLEAGRKLGDGVTLAGAELTRPIDLLALVGKKEMHVVADNRTAESHAILAVLGSCFRAVFVFGDGCRAEVLVGVVPKHIAVEIVAARAGHRGDGGAADLVVFGLVIRGDHLVFSDAQLRKRVAAADILSGDATLDDIVLLAHAVDEHVDAIGVLGTAAQPGRVVVGIGREHHARNDIGEGEKIAAGLWQSVELLGRDVGGDLRSLGLDQRYAGDHDRPQRARDGGRRGNGQIQRCCLPHLHRDGLRTALAIARNIDAIGARRQAGEYVVAVGVRLHVRVVAVGKVGRCDRGVGRRSRIGGNGAAQRR